MRSLKGTLFRGVILGTATVLTVAGTVLYLSVSRHLIGQMDASLADKARTLSLSIEEKHYGLEVDLEEMRVGDLEEGEPPEYFYVGTLDGRVIYQSPLLRSVTLPGLSAPLTTPRHEWQTMESAGRLRSVLITFQPEVDDEEEDYESAALDPGVVVDGIHRPGEAVVLGIFRDSSGHRRFLELFLFMLLATGLGSLGVLSLAVWMTIKKGAQPINELAANIEGISEKDLAERLEDTAVPQELAPLVHKFNTFLDRLEASFNREKGFTSDAAHELRTPLAGLRSTIEVALARKREGESYRETLEGALEIVHQLESLVKSLLALARLESGQETMGRSQVLLERCVRDAWERWGDAAREKGVAASLNFSNGAMAVLDGELLGQVLEELFRNAVYYVDPGGAVKVDLSSEEQRVCLRVANSGSKVSREETERVFDRFWRGVHSRDDTGVRFGLGLPIVRKIVDTMGMQIQVRSEIDGEFVVTLTIPED